MSRRGHKRPAGSDIRAENYTLGMNSNGLLISWEPLRATGRSTSTRYQSTSGASVATPPVTPPFARKQVPNRPFQQVPSERYPALVAQGIEREPSKLRQRTFESSRGHLAWLLLAAVALVLLGGPEPARAHGIGGNVTDHHRWVNMAEQCETRGIPDRWTLDASHPRFNGHFGGLQFNPGTWTSTVTGRINGIRVYRRYPMLARYRYASDAPPWAQMAAGNILKARYGLGQWSCGAYWR